MKHTAAARSKRHGQRGFVLLELGLAIAILMIIIVAIGTVQVQTVRIRREGEISSSTMHMLCSEAQRLRSLPLTSFYTAGGSLRGDIVYYRPLSETSAADGRGSGRMFGRISVHLDLVSTSGGPVQVTIACRPVYLNGTPVATSRPGVNTASASQFQTSTPSRIDLGNLEEIQTFFVL